MGRVVQVPNADAAAAYKLASADIDVAYYVQYRGDGSENSGNTELFLTEPPPNGV
jgi:hypothetical protein